MKIRPVVPENHARVAALLRQAFPASVYEVHLVEKLRRNGRTVHEWACIHTNKVIAYIAFSRAYNGPDFWGWHLAPLAVAPEFQGQGTGAELLRYALRQPVIRDSTVFVLGEPGFYREFGFEPCALPACPFTAENARFLSLRNDRGGRFTVGYEPEFY